MGRRKLPHGKMIHVGVSMPPEMWERVQVIAKMRGGTTSASLILREAVVEYMARRFGPPAVVAEAPVAVPA
jgi:predicted transcriptional regulator